MKDSSGECARANVASDASDMKDVHAERMTLCGLINLGTTFMDRLDASGFTRADFYFDHHQRAFDLFGFVAAANPPPLLLEVWDELVRRARREGTWLGGDFPNRTEAASWVADVYGCFTFWHARHWQVDEKSVRCPKWEVPSDISLWCRGDVHWDQEGMSKVCFAYAERVRWLAARRATIHRAKELIRDALDPIGGVSHYEGDGP